MRAYLIKSIATGLPNAFGSALISMALIPIIIRNIGLDQYGTWTLLFIFVGLNATLDIGIPKALVFLIPKTADRAEVNAFFTASAVIMAGLLAAVLAASAAAIRFPVPVWGDSAAITPELGALLLLAGAAILCGGLISSLCHAILEAHYKIHLVNATLLILTVSNYSVVLAVSVISPRIEHIIYATTTVYLGIALLNIVLMRWSTGVRFARPARRHVKTILSRGKDFFLLGLITSIPRPLMRYLVVFLAANMATCGLYDIALKIAMIAGAVLACFSAPLFGIFSGYGPENIGKIKTLLHRMVFLLAGLLVLGVALYLWLGKAILEFILGISDFRLFAASLILLAGIGANAVFEPYVRALWALGHTQKCAVIRSVVVGVNVGLVALLSFMHEPLYRVSSAFALSLFLGGVLFALLFYRLHGLGAPTATGAMPDAR